MTISEVSKMLDLSQDTIRYYERIGLIPSIMRKSSGVRDFSEDDCKNINFIKCMRNAGMPIEVLIEYVSLVAQGESTEVARQELIIEQRKILMDKVEEMKQTIERLDYKIEFYGNRALNKKES
ncbi:MerR family transcriptional regulator [Fusibacter ferrireducens]|uniref:MerR family transcriptional regulator n=1 Tax=Fusibacter ferrireducens TaxID=2785058 RepID=A0ABR9ZQ82_9FIRM|nr:MerR family transcriptional regulator [Fusibacter ferrireducens]MBF4692607.1 MerR family transcriptional regulator [Fusibacter ferrireducens]